jgi:hypothetical protein
MIINIVYNETKNCRTRSRIRNNLGVGNVDLRRKYFFNRDCFFYNDKNLTKYLCFKLIKGFNLNN